MPLVANITIDSTTWAAVALVLTVLGAAYSWFAYRRRGPAAGLRGLAWTLVPVAAWLTGTLKLAANILNDVLAWASRLVFSPTVWLGIVVAGVAVALWFLSGALLARGVGVRARVGVRDKSGVRDKAVAEGDAKQVSRRPRKDDIEDMDDIEAILKRHGI